MSRDGDLMDILCTAVEAMTPAQRAWLRGQGVGDDADWFAGMPGVLDVRFVPRRRWPNEGGERSPPLFDLVETCAREPDRSGRGVVRGAVVIGAWDRLIGPKDWGSRPGPNWRPPGLVDVVAFDPREPSRFATLRGVAAWLPSEDTEPGGFETRPYANAGGALRLCATPLSWLRALGAGEAKPVCLLDDGGRHWRDVFEGVDRVICDDQAHGVAVLKRLRKRYPAPAIPEVVVRRARPAGCGARNEDDRKRTDSAGTRNGAGAA